MAIPGLFAALTAVDPTYTALAIGESEHVMRARALAESLWERTSPYLDADLPSKATHQFHQCFWELYLADCFLQLGVPLVARRDGQRSDVGPDLQIGPNIWVEAIAVTGGVGADAVTEAEPGLRAMFQTSG